LAASRSEFTANYIPAAVVEKLQKNRVEPYPKGEGALKEESRC